MNNSAKEPTILVVDDNNENVRVVCSLLKQQNYNLAVAFDGESAIKLVTTHKVDLILLDVMMPGIDGYETCSRIKQMPQLKDVPVIFLTARAETDDIIKGYKCGGVDYATKPFKAQELSTRIETHLALYHQRAELGTQNANLASAVSEKEIQLLKSNQLLEYVNNELQHRNEQLHRLTQSQNAFLNIVTKEVYATVRDITGRVQILKYRVDSKRDSKTLEQIDDSLKVLEEYVNSAIRITSLKSLKDSIKPQRIHLGKLWGYVIFLLNDDIRQKHLAVHLSDKLHNAYIIGEYTLLVSAFMVVLKYFIMRNPHYGVIEIKENSSAQYGFCIYDYATHVDTMVFNEQADIFMANFQQSSGPFASIALAKSIFELHGGTLNVENLEHQGIIMSAYTGVPKN